MTKTVSQAEIEDALLDEIKRQDGFVMDIRPLAAAVAQHAEQARLEERERCARIADNGWAPAYVAGDFSDPAKWEPGSPWDRGAVDACKRIATAIRKGEAA